MIKIILMIDNQLFLSYLEIRIEKHNFTTLTQ